MRKKSPFIKSVSILTTIAFITAPLACGDNPVTVSTQDPVWLYSFTANQVNVTAGTQAKKYTLTFSELDEDAVVFSDIPDSTETVERETTTITTADLFNGWADLNNAFEAGQDTQGNLIPSEHKLHAPNAAVVMHASDGTRKTFVFSLDQIASYDETAKKVTFTATLLDGQDTPVDGDYSDISVFVDGWIGIIFWCGISIASIIGAVFVCVGTAGAGCFMSVLASIGASYKCATEVCHYVDPNCQM